MDRLHRWFDLHPYASDRLVAAVTAAAVAGELLSGRLLSYDAAIAPSGTEVLISLALVAPLAFGPRSPVAVFAIVMLGCLVQLVATDHVLVADLAPLVALYYVIAHGPAGIKPIALALALAGGALMSWRASFPGVLDGFVVGTGVITSYVLLAALLADRRAIRADRLAALEAERDRQAEAGAAEERARIARELHDVLAHSLAVMVAQADGGRYAASADPGAAAGALEQVAATGRDALGQTRRLLGVLRASDDGPDLRALVDRLSGAGMPVALDTAGSPRELGQDVRSCVHRVAQEALTNVLRHSDSPHRVEVMLRYLDAQVELTVRDDGRGPAAGHQDGLGLAGMRERVALQGGTVEAGVRAGGGFEVRARLPAPTAAEPRA